MSTRALLDAGQLRAEAAAKAAHAAAQDGRAVPVLDTSAVYRTQLRLQQRLAPVQPGLGRQHTVRSQLQRAGVKMLNGKQLEHISGYATTFDQPYDMWDEYGPYQEYVATGAADRTLAADPDTIFLMNHRGALMARTRPGTGMLPTLLLEADSTGMADDVYVNAIRPDVQILLSSIEDGLMTEQSFAFLIDEGEWSEDFAMFAILMYDINRGDVSGVNYGANPLTSIGARSQELMDLVGAMPAGMARGVMSRLQNRSDVGGTSAPVAPGRVVVTAGRGRPVDARDGDSLAVRRLASRRERTAQRIIDQGGPVDLMNLALPWYEIRNAAEDDPAADPDTTDILIFDEIGGSFGVDAKTFAQDLAAITTPNIKVRINSPGGSVFDSIAIHSALLQHPARIITQVDSLAASGASVIAMAGDEIVMMPGSQMMVHDAAMHNDGNAAEMGKAATWLDRQSQNIAAIYAKRTGGDPIAWRDLMLAETWAFADEAVELGLADRVDDSGPARQQDVAPEPVVEERQQRSFDLTVFRYAGRRAAPAPGTRRTNDLPAAGRETREAPRTGRRITQLESMIDD